MKTGTEKIEFIKKSQVPQGKKVTNPRFVAKLRPQKEKPECVRITVGGNLIAYLGDKRTQTTEITTTKMQLNSVLSTPEAKYLCKDVHNFYLKTIWKKKSTQESRSNYSQSK